MLSGLWRVVPGLLACLWMLLALPVAAHAENVVRVPDVTATSVFAFDPETGEVILELNPDERLLIGSVTKVATALVVVDLIDLDEEIVIEGTDMVEPGFSVMGLQPGDTLTVEQLLTGLLVASGGDAAQALARYGGTVLTGNDDPVAAVAAFVEAMNAKARELELTNTHFDNPDGDDSDEAWSTARDVSLMYAALVDVPVLADIVALPSYSFTSVGPEQTLYEAASTNQLVGQYDVTSAKTGSTVDAGGCVVLARQPEAGARTEIVTILGANIEYDETWTPTIDERWNDAIAVMDAIDANWTPGQNLVAPEATAPDVAVVPTPTIPADPNPTQTPPEPEPLVLQEKDGSAIDRPGTGPVLVVTVAGSVMALSGVLAWLRMGDRRS